MAADIEQFTIEGRTQFLPFTVLDAAVSRLATAAKRYDNLVVLFSGGKDSHLCLELVRQAYDGLGWTDKPVKFLFYDRELLEDEIVTTAESYFDNPRFEGIWLAAPQADFMTVMGERQKVTLWDEARKAEWQRVPPDHAMTAIEAMNGARISYPILNRAFVAAIKQGFGAKGSIGLVQGHRFGENATIRRMIMDKEPGACWVFNATGLPGVDFLRPIYDWSIRDVFKFFYDAGIPYCASYDINLHAGGELRAGTPPIDGGNPSWLGTLRETYPTLFTQITTIWPQLLTQERYAPDVDYETIARNYGGRWEGMARYVAERIETPEARNLAAKALLRARGRQSNGRLRGKYPGPCYGMPLLHVWRCLVTGAYRDEIPEVKNVPKRHEAFERWVEEQGSEK